MKELQNRQKFKRYLYSYPSLFVLVVIAFFLAKGAAGIMQKKHESAQLVEDLEEQTQALSERRYELESNIARLQTEDGVVEEIRRKFNVTREGEHVAIILDGKVEATTTEPSAVERLKKGWDKFKRLLKK